MKIGTITFHGAYNYGSVLQAYALQEFIVKLGRETETPIDYKIINYRPQCQKELYWQAEPPFSVKTAVKRLMRMPYKNQLAKQAEAYEGFLADRLNLTEELSEREINRYADEFDFYISGSDQVFNVRSLDFTYHNLLDFTESPNKLSYAASFGPLMINWDEYDKEKYIGYLRKFRTLSMREERSKKIADELLGNGESEVHIDPTLLLDAEDWRKIESGRNYNKGKYIFIYCLEPTKKHMRIAKMLSKALDLPIVCTGYRCKHDYFNSFVKLYDSGPADFLSLIDNAELVLTSSFHGTAFSVIFGKPFWVIDGMADNRICNLLKLTGLEGNSIEIDNLPDFQKSRPHTSGEVDARKVLKQEQEKSREYLKKALGI